MKSETNRSETKKMNFLDKRRILMKVLRSIGKRSLVWGSISVAAGVGLAVFEYLTAVSLGMFFKALGFLDAGAMTVSQHWLWTDLTLRGTFIALVLIAFGRALMKFVVFQASGNAKSQFFMRVRQIILQRLLWNHARERIQTSQANMLSTSSLFGASNFVQQIFQNSSIFLQVLGLFGVMVFNCPNETWIAMLGSVMIGSIGYLASRRTTALGSVNHKQEVDYAKMIVRLSSNWLFHKVSNTETKEFEKGRQITHTISRTLNSLHFWNFFTATSVPFLGTVLIAGIALANYHFQFSEQRVFFMFVYLFVRFVQSAADLVSGVITASEQVPRMKEIYSLFDHGFPLMEGTTLATSKDSLTSLPRPPSISANNLSFEYSEDGKTLHDLNFQINQGEQVGIVGKSGAGKTTLLTLVLGLENPTHGSIELRQSDKAVVNTLTDLRVGFVGSEPYLIEGTILDNLLYGSRPYSMEELHHACRQTGLDDIVAKKGFDYVIKESGDGLSTGQKQRLCLTRAILNSPELLIMDEATANLDLESEKHFLSALNHLKGKTTVLIVSHRASTLENCDKVIRLS